MVNPVHTPTKSKTPTIISILNKTQSSRNSDINHLINSSWWLKSTFKRRYAGCSDSYNFSAKITMLIWKSFCSNKLMRIKTGKPTPSTLFNNLRYYLENCLKSWMIRSSVSRLAFWTLLIRLLKCHVLITKRLYSNLPFSKIFPI